VADFVSMRPPRNLTLLINAKDEDGINRRRHGRLNTESLTINNGVVLDLSASGMRAQVKGKVLFTVGDQAAFRLRSCAREMSVDGRVVWVKKAGFRKHQIGVEFVNITPERMQKLMLLTRDAMHSRVLEDLHI
jgi:hypothetical protein